MGLSSQLWFLFIIHQASHVMQNEDMCFCSDLYAENNLELLD